MTTTFRGGISQRTGTGTKPIAWGRRRPCPLCRPTRPAPTTCLPCHRMHRLYWALSNTSLSMIYQCFHRRRLIPPEFEQVPYVGCTLAESEGKDAFVGSRSLASRLSRSGSFVDRCRGFAPEYRRKEYRIVLVWEDVPAIVYSRGYNLTQPITFSVLF